MLKGELENVKKSNVKKSKVRENNAGSAERRRGSGLSGDDG
jgi:hypothetical protein